MQQEFEDIGKAMKLVSTTKVLLQKWGENAWKCFQEEVNKFYWKHDILIPDMDYPIQPVKIGARRQHDEGTIERFYRVEIYLVTIDKLL